MNTSASSAESRPTRRRGLFALGLLLAAFGCTDLLFGPGGRGEEELDPALVAAGRETFRYDDFGDNRFWTDTLRLHELVQAVDPETALSLGLKVDSDAVPSDVLEAVLADAELLRDPAVTRQLLAMDAVVGVHATVQDDEITRIGITCALCHSSVDDFVAPGIGRRVDGQANRDLAVGTIISLTPGLPDELRSVYASWPAGYFDPRFDTDGISDPIVIPPAYGLNGVEVETYTGEGPVSYWNAYVAVVEMHGVGDFVDPRLGIAIDVADDEDRVTPKLEALRQYQLSLEAPSPPPGSVNPEAAARGGTLFATVAGCATCHRGARFTDGDVLHDPAETGMDGAYAARATTGRYRTTPLRGLWQHAPYFHDGSAATLMDVVDHYDTTFGLGLAPGQKADLVEYLRTL